MQGDGGGDQWVVAECGHGLQIARDSTVGVCKGYGSEASGDLLLDLGHADITLASVVGERGVGAPGKAQDVLSSGRRGVRAGYGASDLATGPRWPFFAAGFWGICERPCLEDRLVASCDALVVAHGQALLGALDDLSACDEQQLVHLRAHGVVVAVGYGLQFPEQVRAAELMLALGVGEVGFPAVMDDEAAVAGDDAEGVDRLTAAFAVQALTVMGPPAQTWIQ